MSDAVTILALNSDESGLERFKLNASKAVLCDGSATTQPVSVAGTVGVSGSFFPATQPVSIATNVPKLIQCWTGWYVVPHEQLIRSMRYLESADSVVAMRDKYQATGEYNIEHNFRT